MTLQQLHMNAMSHGKMHSYHEPVLLCNMSYGGAN